MGWTTKLIQTEPTRWTNPQHINKWRYFQPILRKTIRQGQNKWIYSWCRGYFWNQEKHRRFCQSWHAIDDCLWWWFGKVAWIKRPILIRTYIQCRYFNKWDIWRAQRSIWTKFDNRYLRWKTVRLGTKIYWKE